MKTKGQKGQLLAAFLTITMLVGMFAFPLPVFAEELETFSAGEFKENVEIPQGKIGKYYTFTPTESGTYALTGYVGSLTVMSFHVSDGTQTIAYYDLPGIEDDYHNGTCVFEAEAGQTYEFCVSGAYIFGGDTFYMDLRLDKAVMAVGVSLWKSSITGSIGDELDLTMRFDPLWSIPEDCTWSVDDPSVATIDANGHLTLLADGSTTVRLITASGLSAQCSVEVITATERIELDVPMTVTLKPDEKICFAFDVPETDEYCLYTDEKSSVFNHIGSAYSTLEKDLYYLTEGSEELFTIRNGHSMEVRTFTVHMVKTAPVESVEIEGGTVIYAGDWMYLNTKCDPIWATNEYSTWTSSDSSVATVEYGMVTAVGEGTADITVTMSGGATATVTVTVLGADSYEEISCGDSKMTTLDYLESRRYTFTPEKDGKYVFYMQEGETMWDPETGYGQNKDFALSILRDGMSIGEYVYTDGYRGICCEMTAGNTYTLNAHNNFWGQEEVTGVVTLDELTPPEAITITAAQNTIFAGEYFFLTCKPKDGPPFLIDEGEVTWTISDENIVTLDFAWSPSASFKTNAAGKATITATLANGMSASYEVVISEYVYYDIISGHGDTVILGTDDSLTVHIDAAFEKFTGFVSVDGVEVPQQNFTATEGSTIITLDAEYLETLEPGGHILIAQFKDGEAGMGFAVQEKPEALPGDVNGDGNVSIADLMRLANYFAKGADINDANANVNGDDKVSIADLMRLANFFAGKAELG